MLSLRKGDHHGVLKQQQPSPHNNKNNNNHPISSTSAEASDQSLVSSVGGFDKFCAFIVQQYRNLNDNRRLFQGSADAVQQTLHNSTFKMVIDVGTSMFNADSSAAGASPQLPTSPNGLSGAFSGFPTSNTSSSTSSSAANQAAPMSPLQIAVAAAALNNNIQLFNSLQQSQPLNPNGNGSAQPAFPEFVPRDNGFAQARWNVSDLAETTMLESDISPPQGLADVGANVGDQIAATATGEKKKRNKSASASRRKQTSPGKVISRNDNDNDGSSSSGNGSPQPSTSGASASSNSPSKEEKKASKRSLNAANKPFSCEVSGCKKSYVHEFNLAKHMLVVHQGYKADTAANVVVSNGGDGGDAQQQQQQLLNTESIFNSSQPSPDKATPQHGKRPRLDEHADEEEEEEVNEAGGEEAAAEADNAAEQLFSSSDHHYQQQQQQLGDYASMPNDLFMAFLQESFLNTPP
ncbi:hypothetical protein TYRP_003823 [Tyrophagus putrescentiae]|nr:hypothetical protein TYRP_003823 [Tyrophagus putrescentiae]